VETIELKDLEWIRRLAGRLAGEADDVAQDTWLAAARARPDLSRPLRPWLTEVARNLIRARWRTAPRRRRREQMFHEQGAEHVAAPDVAHARAQLHQIVIERVLALDEPYRQVVLLRFFEDRSSAQIASTLGVPAGTVRWRLKTAMDRLRSDLDQRFGGDRPAWVVLAAPVAPAAGGDGAQAAARDARPAAPAPRVPPILVASLVAGALALVMVLMMVIRLLGPDAAVTAGPDPGGAGAIALDRATLRWQLDPSVAPGRIAGLVRDADGDPVAGATILATRQRAAEPDSASREELVASARSDSGGRFQLDRLRPGHYVLTAGADGHAASQADVALRPGQERNGLAITLGRNGIELTGRLRDSGGGPIGGGNVRVFSVADDLKPGPVFTAAVAADGGYRLILPAGEYLVRAQASGYAGQFRNVPLFVKTRQDFQLHPGAGIRGRIEGLAADDAAQVVAELFPQQQGLVFPRSQLKVDEAGRFSFVDLSPGSYVIEARRGNQIGRSAEVLVGPGQSRDDVVIRLQPMPLLLGTVRARAGQALAQVLVSATVSVGEGYETSRAVAFTDGRGAFAIPGVWPGRVTVLVDAPGFGRASRVVKLTQANPEPLDIVLDPDSRVRGTVLQPGGEPAAFARLTLITHQGRTDQGVTRLHTFADRLGGFSVEGLTGVLEVRADHATGLGRTGPLSLTPGQLTNLEVRLAAGSFVSGTVRNEDGTPAVGAHVRGRRRGTAARTLGTGPGFLQWVPREPLPAETAADGSFRIGPFDEGEVAIRASVPDVPGLFTTDPRPDSKWLRLSAGEERTGVVLILDPATGSISGRVLDDQGAALAGVMVFVLTEQDGIAVAQDSPRAAAVVSAADGSFTVERLRRGKYTLRASHPDLASTEQRHLAPGTREVTLQLRKAASIGGVVVSRDGRPVPDYALVATLADYDGESIIRMYRRLAGVDAFRLTVHDPSGRFELKDLPPGNYDLGITSPRDEAALLRGLAVVAGGREDLKIVVAAGAVVMGRVVDAVTGAAIARASIEGQGAALELRTIADERGQFVLAGVPRDPVLELHVFGAHEAYMREIQILSIAGPRVDLGTVRVQPGSVNHTFNSPGMAGFTACTRDGQATVRQVGPSTAARAAGLRAGDRIVSLDGRSMAGISGSMVQALAMGAVGAPLELTVETPGQPPRPVRILRKARNRTRVTER
jgi:RNA polymerase sigma factor (sigma-70 family)